MIFFLWKMDLKYPEINVSEGTFKTENDEDDEKEEKNEKANFIISGVIVKTFLIAFLFLVLWTKREIKLFL